MDKVELRSVIFSKIANRTGARIDELESSTWTDLNEEKSVIILKASKNAKIRMVRVVLELIAF